MLSILEIGERISVARKMKNLSQAQLAEMLSISAQAVGKWERGESMPDIITFGRLSEVLGVDLNYFGGTAKAPADFFNTAQVHKTDPDRMNWNMSNANWSDIDFSGLHGLAEKLSGSNIDKCQFENSEMSGLILKNNNIKDSKFTSSNLSHCKFSSTSFYNDGFAFVDLSKSEFIRSTLKMCDFTEANLSNVLSKWSHFKNVDFSEATLTGMAFQFGQLTEIVFSGDVADCCFENCDFTRVEFKGAIIRNTFFKNCKLKHVKFTACKADKLSLAFLKACKADTSSIAVI